MDAAGSQTLLSAEAFTQRLRAVGEEGYHDKHPFHLLMHEGKLTQRQLQAWIENRFYYQAIIPKKDAAIMAKVDDPAVRRAWIQRIIDHDGTRGGEGGIHKWLVLAAAAWLGREGRAKLPFVLACVRFPGAAFPDFVQPQFLLA